MAKLLGKIAIYVDGPEDDDRSNRIGSYGQYHHEEHEYDIHIRAKADAAAPVAFPGAEPSILAHELGHAIAVMAQAPAENNWKETRAKYFNPFISFIGIPQPHNDVLKTAKIKQEHEAWEIGEKVLNVAGAKLNKKIKEAALRTYDDYEA